MKRWIRLLCLALLPYTALFSQKGTKPEGVSLLVPENPSCEQVIRLATQVRPSYRQLDYQQREMLGFIHIGMNTFTGKEWGTGKESPAIFNPSELNAEEWIRTFQTAGITGVILVAKHHDGFCVWPSKYTKHTVAHSPWRDGKGDLVKEVADACRKYGMKLCLYLSPWDMNAPTYGTEAYNDYYIHQLEELLTNYGPVYLLWFDGAGTQEEVSGKNMPFDWERIFRRARELQPDVLLSGNAPDVRWVGNEKGKGRSTEWCVQGVNESSELFGALIGYDHTRSDLGSVEDLQSKHRLVWYPSRGGLPLRRGWFYHPADDLSTKSLSYLIDSYFSTVGQNSNLLPNLSPEPSGKMPRRDAERLIEFGRLILDMKSVDYAKGAKAIADSCWEVASSETLTDESPFTSWNTVEGQTTASVILQLKEEATFNVIKLQENVRDFGQRVEQFAIDAWQEGDWKEIMTGTTIGYRRMLRLCTPIHTNKLRIRFLDARLSVSLGTVSCFFLQEVPEEEVLSTPSHEVCAKVSVQGFEGEEVKNLYDGNSATLWKGMLTQEPASFIFKMDQMASCNGIRYLPGTLSKGHVELYAVYASDDGLTWGDSLVNGRFGNIENNPVAQRIYLPRTQCKFVKLEVLKTVADSKEIEIAELTLVND